MCGMGCVCVSSSYKEQQNTRQLNWWTLDGGFQSIKLIANVNKYLYLFVYLLSFIRELIDMSIDFNVISMTGFLVIFSFIWLIFGLLREYTITQYK